MAIELFRLIIAQKWWNFAKLENDIDHMGNLSIIRIKSRDHLFGTCDICAANRPQMIPLPPSVTSMLSPRAYFSRIFRVAQHPAQKVGNRQVRKKLTERCTKSEHNFHVNVWLANFGNISKCISRREMYNSVCEQKPSHPGNCKFIFW